MDSRPNFGRKRLRSVELSSKRNRYEHRYRDNPADTRAQALETPWGLVFWTWLTTISGLPLWALLSGIIWDLLLILRLGITAAKLAAECGVFKLAALRAETAEAGRLSLRTSDKKKLSPLAPRERNNRKNLQLREINLLMPKNKKKSASLPRFETSATPEPVDTKVASSSASDTESLSSFVPFVTHQPAEQSTSGLKTSTDQDTPIRTLTTTYPVGADRIGYQSTSSQLLYVPPDPSRDRDESPASDATVREATYRDRKDSTSDDHSSISSTRSPESLPDSERGRQLSLSLEPLQLQPSTLTVPDLPVSGTTTPGPAIYTPTKTPSAATQTPEETELPVESTDTGLAMSSTRVIDRVLPEPKEKQCFNGWGATDWLEDMEWTFSRYEVNNPEKRIETLPHWTSSSTIKERMKAALEEATTWEEARTAVLKAFKLNDVKQTRTAKDRLRTLTQQPFRSTPEQIVDFCQDYGTKVRDIIKESRAAGKEKNKDDYVEGLIEGIDADCLEEILLFCNKKYDTFFATNYDEVYNTIMDWAASKASLLRHSGRKRRTVRFDQEQEDDDRAQQPQHQSSSRPQRQRSPSPVSRHQPLQRQNEVPDLTEAFNKLTIANANLMKDSMKQIIAEMQAQGRIAPSPSPNPYYMQPSGESQWNTAPSVTQLNALTFQPDSFNRGGWQGKGNGRGGNRNGGKTYTAFVCHFCLKTGHRLEECDLLYNMVDTKMISYETDGRAFWLGARENREELNLRFPLWMKLQAIDLKFPIATAICNWIKNEPSIVDYFKKQAQYYLARETIMDNPNPNRPSPSANPPPTQVQPTTILKQPRVEEADDQEKPRKLYSAQMITEDGELFFKEAPMRDWIWSDPVPVMGSRHLEEIHTIKIDEGDEAPVVTSIMLAKRTLPSEDGFQYTFKKQRTDADQPMPDKPTDPEAAEASQSGEDNGDNQGGTISASQVKFWEAKIRENAKKRFEITWTDLIEMCPDFTEAFKNFLADKALESLNNKAQETIRLTETEVRGNENVSAKKNPKILNMEVMEIDPVDGTSGPDPPAQLFTTRVGDLTDFVTPLFRLAVRIGHGGGEDLISGVLDTGAESSVIVASYVRQNGIEMRQTRVCFTGFNTKHKTPFLGIIEAPVWLANRKIIVPIYVVNDEFAAQPLILGLNFMTKARMTLNLAPDNMEGTLEFGVTKIIIPLIQAGRVHRNIKDIETIVAHPENS